LNETTKLILAVAVTAMVCIGGSYMVFGGGGDNERDTRIMISGSTTVQPLMDAWQLEYEKNNRVAMYVSGGGSDAGPNNLISGISDMGMRSSALASYSGGTEAQRKLLTEHVIAYDAVVITLNADVTGITTLSLGQLKSIFNGSYTNWKEVSSSAPDKAIKPIVREAGSGTRDSFDKMVMIAGVTGANTAEGGNSNTVTSSASAQSTTGAVINAVKDTAGAIGYVNMDMIPMINADAKLKYVQVGGVNPTDTTVQNFINNSTGSKYPLSRKLFVVTYGEPMSEVTDFIKWMYSDDAQKIVKNLGFVPLPADVRTSELAKL
jgi:phosphate transport system substrate-binding protein